MHQILIIDDDASTRATYGAVLRDAGYQVLQADCGSQAIAVLERTPLSAALLDLRLPDMTGLEVLRAMRTRGRFVPTAVVTAFASEFDPDEAIELGALAYADQPLSIESLLAVTRTLVRPPSSEDDADGLHRRVLAGDPAALDALAEICLRELPRRLERAFPREPWDFAVGAVSDACLFYASGGAFRLPKDPPVLDLLFSIAWRRLDNQRRSERSRAARERRWAAGQPAVANPEIARESFDVWAAVMAVVKDPRERRAAEIWLHTGIVDETANALGAGGLPTRDRRRVVKQFKDRVIKRLSRHLRE